MVGDSRYTLNIFPSFIIDDVADTNITNLWI